MLFALSAIGASVERLRRVQRAVFFDVAVLARALGRQPRRDKLIRMRELVESEGESWECEVLEAALDARSDAERVARIDELVADAGAALDWGARIPAGAARLSALGSLSVLFFGLARGHMGLLQPLPLLAWGGAGVVGALAAGREANRIAEQTRKGIDSWVERVLHAART